MTEYQFPEYNKDISYPKCLKYHFPDKPNVTFSGILLMLSFRGHYYTHPAIYLFKCRPGCRKKKSFQNILVECSMLLRSEVQTNSVYFESSLSPNQMAPMSFLFKSCCLWIYGSIHVLCAHSYINNCNIPGSGILLVCCTYHTSRNQIYPSFKISYLHQYVR